MLGEIGVRPALLVLVGAVTIASCSGEEAPDNPGSGGRGGSGGSAGSAGTGGSSGSAGNGGSAGQPDGGDGSVDPQCQTACVSGRCEEDGDCQHCTSDAECQGGRLCASGTCLAACTGDSGCPSGFSCCSGRCADLTRDFGNCRACGSACTGESFCGSAGCQPALVSALCQVPRITLVLGGGEVDDAETALVSAKLASTCTTAPTLRTVTEADATFLHPVTARPALGSGEAVVVLGGTAFQQVVKYLEDSALTRIFNYYDPSEVRFHRRGAADGGSEVLVQAPQSQITNTHSYFLIESVVEPTSHTWVLEVYGLSVAGTRAASWFFRNRVLPAADPATYGKRYFVYEWQSATATSNDPVEPGEGDTFTLVSSGP